MFAEVACFLSLANVFRETLATFCNHIGKDMSSLRMRVDQQNCQAGKVALGCKSIVKAFGKTSNDACIIELDAVLQILFDLINDRTQ